MEKKPVGILIEQATAGGAVINFLLFTGVILFNPNYYNFFLLGYLPIILAAGTIFGIVSGTLIWISQVVLRRCPGLLVRWVLAVVSIFITGGVWQLVMKFLGADADVQDSAATWTVWAWYLGEVCFLGLTIGLITGSSLRPMLLLMLGPPAELARTTVGSWLSFPAALLLRVLGIFSLMVSLLILAYWASSYVVAKLMGLDRPILFTRAELVPILIAVLYLAATVCVGLGWPRKVFLMVLWILINAPLTSWGIREIRNPNSNYEPLPIFALIFIGLWTVLVVGRMISARSIRQHLNEAQ